MRMMFGMKAMLFSQMMGHIIAFDRWRKLCYNGLLLKNFTTRNTIIEVVGTLEPSRIKAYHGNAQDHHYIYAFLVVVHRRSLPQ